MYSALYIHIIMPTRQWKWKWECEWQWQVASGSGCGNEDGIDAFDGDDADASMKWNLESGIANSESTIQNQDSVACVGGRVCVCASFNEICHDYQTQCTLHFRRRPTTFLPLTEEATD